MESSRGDMKWRGVSNLNADTKSRMASRPTGVGFGDFGSDFAASSTSKDKPFTAKKSRRPRDSMEDSYKAELSESEDELDFLSSSQSSRHSSREPRTSKPKALNKDVSQDEEPPLIYVDGQYHQAHPDFKRDGTRYSGLKFKKKSKADADSIPTSSTTISSSTSAPSTAPSKPVPRPTSTVPPKASSSHVNALSKPFKVPSRAGKPTDAVRIASPPRSRRTSPARRKPSTDSDEDSIEEIEETPRPMKKAVPQPRPVKAPLLSLVDTATVKSSNTGGGPDRLDRKGKGRATAANSWPMEGISPVKDPRPPRSRQPFPMHDISPLKESGNARNTVPRPFPMELSTAKDENNSGSKEKKKSKATTPPPPAGSKRSTAPQKQPTQRKVQEFPHLSPLSSSNRPSTQERRRSSQGSQAKRVGTGRRVVLSSEESEASASETKFSPKRPKVRPFPMTTQVLESIGNVSQKRGSSDNEISDPETGQREKKRVRGAHEMCVRAAPVFSSERLINAPVCGSLCTRTVCQKTMTMIYVGISTLR